jgi:hypothetical protein
MAKEKSNFKPLLPQPADFRRVKEVDFCAAAALLKDCHHSTKRFGKESLALLVLFRAEAFSRRALPGTTPCVLREKIQE